MQECIDARAPNLQVDIAEQRSGNLGHGPSYFIDLDSTATSAARARASGSISQTTAVDPPNRKSGHDNLGRVRGPRRNSISEIAMTVERGHMPMTFIFGHTTCDDVYGRRRRSRPPVPN